MQRCFFDMPTTTDPRTVTVALLGNPNTGKSTLFNALAGVHQRIGNYPGVTVEKRLGHARFSGHAFTFIDLPGTYSLAPQSPDEMVAVDVLLGRRRDVAAPNVILCILDATNLERNLYVLSQALELERPVVVALNMMDLAEQRGVCVDVACLSARLGVPVIPIQAHRRLGIDEVKNALLAAVYSDPPHNPVGFPSAFCNEVDGLYSWLRAHAGAEFPRYLVERLLLDTTHYMEQLHAWGDHQQLRSVLWEARRRLEHAGHHVPAVETKSRYAWVDKTLEGVIHRTPPQRMSRTDRLDQVLTHPIIGIVIFLVVMVFVFQAIFTWTAPLNSAIEMAEHWLGQLLTRILPSGMLQSLLVNGVVAGAGAVLTFLPQIALLFFFIAILEDCGYMARAAYLMDGLMAKVGLSGKSFIPLLSSFACAVPGIMSARVIENPRDRIVTILIAPLMSCSARLPVYTLLISAFIPHYAIMRGWLGLQGLTMFGLYGIGITVAVVMAKLLKRTLFKGETPPFMMELPDYRIPLPRVVGARVIEQCGVFIRNAGTLILAVTVIVWAAAYFPHAPQIESQVRDQFAPQMAAFDAQIAALETNQIPDEDQSSQELKALLQQRAELSHLVDGRVAGTYMEQSLLGRIGKLIAPVVRPLGWDWRIGCAVVASFPAREVVIGAMGVIYNLGEGQNEHSRSLAENLRRAKWPGTNRHVFTVPVALSLLVFYALCAQCAATLIVISRETGKRRWAVFTFVYMTSLAYTGALLTYQIGSWLGNR